tara:strand:- start:244 stop:417 length:174 start_codon:yes stop_codon:yes gene_type:complete
MKIQSVKVVPSEKLGFVFIYDGCPDDLIRDRHGDPLFVDSLDKAEGFIECMIQLGWI